MDENDKACEVPLVEQLRSVPKGTRVTLEVQWASDGTPTGHQFIPAGDLVHRAADELASLRSALQAAEKDAERYRWLRMSNRGVYWLTASHGPAKGVYEGEYVWGNCLDAAIDAALKGSAQ